MVQERTGNNLNQDDSNGNVKWLDLNKRTKKISLDSK